MSAVGTGAGGQRRGVHWLLVFNSLYLKDTFKPAPRKFCLLDELTCIRLVSPSPMIPCPEDIFHLSPEARRSVLDPAVDGERHCRPLNQRLSNDTSGCRKGDVDRVEEMLKVCSSATA